MNARRALPRFATLLGTAALLLMMPAACQAFSVLAHQAIVDQAWEGTLVSAVRKRFPNATQQELEDARGYARGGSHLPTWGIFPSAAICSPTFCTTFVRATSTSER
jgi:hypothetical protein